MNKQSNTGNAGAHSNVRIGGSDYTDGENVEKWLGNDDYKNGANLGENPYADPEDEKEIGKVANGNNLEPEQPTDQ